MGKTEKEILELLLKYWVEHNKQHGEEFKKWARKAKLFKADEVHNYILKASRKMDEANEFLLKALEKLKKER